MFNPTSTLDLTSIPTHWNQCSAEQLETIARVIRDEQERVTPFHPFSMQSVKTALFFLFSEICIVEPLNPRVKVEDQYYECMHPSIQGIFHLYLWQIDYWVNGVPDYKKIADHNAHLAEKDIDLSPSTTDISPSTFDLGPKKVRGLLDWIDDAKDIGLTLMPYETFRLRKHSDSLMPFVNYLLPKRTFQAPQPLMSNFSWQQYRYAQDYMDNYIRQANAYIKMNEHRTRYSPTDLIKQEQTVDLSRALFLSTIFDTKVRYIDTDTKKVVYGFHYTSNQHTDNAQYFRCFPEDKWQVILFWWSGMMRYLQRKYPHVFTEGKVKNGKARQNPLEVYTATITTLEKYLHQTEEELNRKTFILTLETLERMAKENEQLERISKRK